MESKVKLWPLFSEHIVMMAVADKSIGARRFKFSLLSFFQFFLKKYFMYLFLEVGREGEREREKHQCVVACHTSPTRDLACNPGLCPDWESNRGSFGLQASTQSTEAHQPGLLCSLQCWVHHFPFLTLCITSHHQTLGC